MQFQLIFFGILGQHLETGLRQFKLFISIFVDCHNLECHSRVFNYTPRWVNHDVYSTGITYDRHLRSAFTIIICL